MFSRSNYRKHDPTSLLLKFTAKVLLLLTSGLIVGCMPHWLHEASLLRNSEAHTPQKSVTVTVFTRSLVSEQDCSAAFVSHTLDHITNIKGNVIGLYESNGAGVGVNDLDNDGDLDIVLANLDYSNTILWNDGNLQFRTQRLGAGNSRAVSTVDVDADGWLDIVFTQRFDKPRLWLNQGRIGTGTFLQQELPGVNNPFYTIDWADLDADGDLDLVAASYDTELRKKWGPIFDYRGGGVGVFVYEQNQDGFEAHRLANEADTLAMALLDLNHDEQLDILVGHDFDRPDQAWMRADGIWKSIMPFAEMTQNTMSFDVGDINNDGAFELFATDMKPYRTDAETMRQWEPLMGMMHHPIEKDDPQILENVLLLVTQSGSFQNQAEESGLSATGWSWSSKFGDLNNDGFLDVYVTNGMIAEGLLDHLPDRELVEQNQAFRNDGTGHFVPAQEWNLGVTASGRGMSMGDLDEDGDLDIVVNNLRSPARLFENQLCEGSSLQVDLRWPDSQNPFAIGSELALHTSTGTYFRTVRVSSGYLSGDPARIHFGFPSQSRLEKLEIRWPDGAVSSFGDLEEQTLVAVERRFDR